MPHFSIVFQHCLPSHISCLLLLVSPAISAYVFPLSLITLPWYVHILTYSFEVLGRSLVVVQPHLFCT